jgi:hypothetical protein
VVFVVAQPPTTTSAATTNVRDTGLLMIMVAPPLFLVTAMQQPGHALARIGCMRIGR